MLSSLINPQMAPRRRRPAPKSIFASPDSNPLGITSLADPHTLTLIESHRYKNYRGEGSPLLLRRLSLATLHSSTATISFGMNTSKKSLRKSSGMNTSKTKDLKYLYNEHLRKKVGGGGRSFMPSMNPRSAHPIYKDAALKPQPPVAILQDFRFPSRTLGAPRMQQVSWNPKLSGCTAP